MEIYFIRYFSNHTSMSFLKWFPETKNDGGFHILSTLLRTQLKVPLAKSDFFFNVEHSALSIWRRRSQRCLASDPLWFITLIYFVDTDQIQLRTLDALTQPLSWTMEINTVRPWVAPPLRQRRRNKCDRLSMKWFEHSMWRGVLWQSRHSAFDESRNGNSIWIVALTSDERFLMES